MTPKAPRADVLGLRAIEKLIRAFGHKRPSKERLHKLGLVGDIAGNSLYYSLVGVGGKERAWVMGPALGAAAGGAMVLPKMLGLGKKPTRRTPATTAMTTGWYFVGVVVAAGTYKAVQSLQD